MPTPDRRTIITGTDAYRVLALDLDHVTLRDLASAVREVRGCLLMSDALDRLADDTDANDAVLLALDALSTAAVHLGRAARLAAADPHPAPRQEA